MADDDYDYECATFMRHESSGKYGNDYTDSSSRKPILCKNHKLEVHRALGSDREDKYKFGYICDVCDVTYTSGSFFNCSVCDNWTVCSACRQKQQK